MCIVHVGRYGEYYGHQTFNLVSSKGLDVIILNYTVISVVEHYTAALSVVDLQCALDMSKAFDKVNHYHL